MVLITGGEGIPLETAANAVFDDSNRAAVSIGPDRANIRWIVKRLVTSTSSVGARQPSLKVYKNVETPSALLDSTINGNSSVSETDIKVSSTERLLFVWDGGSVGSYATISISGEIF